MAPQRIPAQYFSRLLGDFAFSHAILLQSIEVERAFVEAVQPPSEEPTQSESDPVGILLSSMYATVRSLYDLMVDQGTLGVPLLQVAYSREPPPQEVGPQSLVVAQFASAKIAHTSEQTAPFLGPLVELANLASDEPASPLELTINGPGYLGGGAINALLSGSGGSHSESPISVEATVHALVPFR